MTNTKITDLTGNYTVAELVSLRDRRTAWNGAPNVEYEAALCALCDDALSQIGQDGDATGVEITAGQITALLCE